MPTICINVNDSFMNKYPRIAVNNGYDATIAVAKYVLLSRIKEK